MDVAEFPNEKSPPTPSAVQDQEQEEEEWETERTAKRCRLPRRQVVKTKKICAKDERNASLRKVSVILQKSENDRTSEESQVLSQYSDAVEQVQQRWRKRREAKKRLEEYEEPPDVLQTKCHILAQAIAQSQHLVVYTGAGISTAAKIPDYRGSNGIWTRLQQGKDIGAHDLTQAEPTYTHMALYELYRRKILKYVVSQNCDGLHLRSGLPKTVLSELHGNMYVEVCKNCKPAREYLRLFDVTENTARYSHKTCRMCYECGEPLSDTIVHFGERGSLQWPLNWSGACQNAERATTILCLGSSLKVLKKYPWLWRMDKPVNKRPNLYIVNLQWTPKDDVANVKVNGKCDQVMKTIMDVLGIQVPSYDKSNDPIFAHSSVLCGGEEHTTNQTVLNGNCDEGLDVKKEEVEALEPDQVTVAPPHQLLQFQDLSVQKLVLNHNNHYYHHNHQLVCDFRGDSFSNSKSLPARSSFSIDDILQRPNHRALNLHFDLLCYPYATSFLYPGLHSIIKPFEGSDGQMCGFCRRKHDSQICLFYKKYEPKFSKKRVRFSKSENVDKEIVCLCCDYSTDEDDSTNEIINESGATNQRKIQAGWFGKGYKKNRRLRKK